MNNNILENTISNLNRLTILTCVFEAFAEDCIPEDSQEFTKQHINEIYQTVEECTKNLNELLKENSKSQLNEIIRNMRNMRNQHGKI